jgi:FkbM family methyltransferase
MKEKIKYILKKILGLNNYLFLLGIYKVYAPQHNDDDEDFPHFLSLLPNEGTVLDIGSNVGYTTVQISKKIKNCQIYSFEPIQSNISAFKKLIKFMGIKNVKLFEFAVGNTNTETEIVVPIINLTEQTNSSHLKKDNEEIPENSVCYKVSVRTLDSIEELKGKKINAIKIDVEGFESTVFTGGIELLKINKPIIYSELNGDDNKKLSIGILSGIGYKMYIFEKNKLILFDPVKHKRYNYFFLP